MLSTATCAVPPRTASSAQGTLTPPFALDFSRRRGAWLHGATWTRVTAILRTLPAPTTSAQRPLARRFSTPSQLAEIKTPSPLKHALPRRLLPLAQVTRTACGSKQLAHEATSQLSRARMENAGSRADAGLGPGVRADPPMLVAPEPGLQTFKRNI